METLKHTVWALALLVIAGVVSLSFETAKMEIYTFILVILGGIALFVLAFKQFGFLKKQMEWKETILINELNRKKQWVVFEKELLKSQTVEEK